MEKRQKSLKIGISAVAALALLVIISCVSGSPSSPTNTPGRINDDSGTLTSVAVSSLEATSTSLPTDSPTPTNTSITTQSPVPPIDSLKAMVTTDLLSCRYGPGSEYLFLYGLRKGANIRLIGRTDGNNWVYVDGKNKCWVNEEYIDIAGDKNSLPVVYPGVAKLPVSPYYPPTTVLKVLRDKTTVTVKWLDIPLKPGDEEDASMQHYIIEVWRCEAGQMIFDPLATNDQTISFTDEPGCSVPSHGRIFVQEKHGFAGPTEILWPPYQ